MIRRLLPLMLALALALPAWADMAESLKREFHQERELGIAVITDSNLSMLEKTLRNPEVRLLVVQVTPSRFQVRHAVQVLDWVRAGHSVWVYDSRLAAMFGMRPYELKKEMFRLKPEDGDLGDQNYQGAATVTLATGPHAVLAGVGQATVFLPEIEPGLYPAVAVEGDTVPLLQFAPDSPALAALRREGRGLVVFKPLLWTKPLSGERFQMNLLEFSAGFQVPGVGGEGKIGDPPGPEAAFVEGNPAVPLAGSSDTRVVATPLPQPAPSPSAEPSPAATAAPRPSPTPTAAAPNFPDRIEVAGEGTLEARVLDGKLRFETTGESLLMDVGEVRTLSIRSPAQLDRLETRDGRTLSGFLLTDEVHLALPSGERTVSKRKVTRIDFGDPR